MNFIETMAYLTLYFLSNFICHFYVVISLDYRLAFLLSPWTLRVDLSSCSKEVIADIQKELRLLSYCTASMGYNDHINFRKGWETRYKELIQSTPTEEKGK